METVDSVKILFDTQRDELDNISIRRLISRTGKRQGIKISLDIVNPVANLSPLENMERILRTNSDYDFVIVHLGSKSRRDAYEIAEKCRELSHAVLVAESSIYPMGESEVLQQNFDEYINSPKEDNLIKLLESHGFLPKA